MKRSGSEVQVLQTYLYGVRPLNVFEASGEAVSVKEVGEMAAEPFVAIIMVSLDGSVIDGPVHVLGLADGPRMVGLGQAVADPIYLANHFEPHQPCDDSVPVLKLLGKFDAGL